MSNADKMFEKLGFIKDYEFDDEVLYISKYPAGRDVLSIEFSRVSRDIGYIYFYSDIENLVSFDLLSAINEKVRELRGEAKWK